MKTGLSTIILLSSASSTLANLQILQTSDLEKFDNNNDFSSVLINLETESSSIDSNSHQVMKRQTFEGSGFEANFEAALTVTSSQNVNSALSSFTEDLNDPSTTTFQQAVIEAKAVINNLMASVISDLGLTSYKIVILGFRQAGGSGRKRRSAENGIEILFEIVFDASEVASSSETVSATSVQDSLVSSVQSSSSDENSAYSFSEVLSVEESEDSSNADSGNSDPLAADCPPCWVYHDGKCLPDQSKMHLFCGSTSMQLKLEKCVMGNTNIESLNLNQDSCRSNSFHVSELTENDSQYYVANVGLDECQTQMSVDSNQIVFQNHLISGANYGNTIEFSCKYATEYSDVGDGVWQGTNLDSSINSAGLTDLADNGLINANEVNPFGYLGHLGFTINFYKNHYFQKQKSKTMAFRAGQKLYFGVEMINPISNVQFTVTSCKIKNKDENLEYSIMTDRCPNTKVRFQIYDNLDNELTKFAYNVFEFKGVKSRTLHLACNVVVCDENDSDSFCQSEASCGNGRRRRRRGAIAHQNIAKRSIAISQVIELED